MGRRDREGEWEGKRERMGGIKIRRVMAKGNV